MTPRLSIEGLTAISMRDRMRPILRDVSLGQPPQLGRRVVVIGGGNVAYDISRTRKRENKIRVRRFRRVEVAA